MPEKKVILKPLKEKAIKNRHHWIFSGAIAELPKFTDGEFLPVYSSKKEFLGTAYFNRKSSIVGRMVAFDNTSPLEAIEKNIYRAIDLRRKFFDDLKTNCYRLINAEGDMLPGLIVDKYGDCLVMQITTKGMDVQRDWLVDKLKTKLNPTSIFEKSTLSIRKDEGLDAQQGWLFGNKSDGIEVLENNLKFKVFVEEGQKTGFFLDHRNMRQLIRTHSKDKKVLNCFSYTGGFSVYALAGSAHKVDSVDISETATAQAEENVRLNGFASNKNGFYAQDVFQFLRENPLDYQIVILDPPAFAKKQKDVITACRGYKDINRIAMQKMPAQSILLTSSCSYYVNEELFQKVVFQASLEAKRQVKIIGRHQLAEDHPINICHPEGDYLKSLLLFIE